MFMDSKAVLQSTDFHFFCYLKLFILYANTIFPGAFMLTATSRSAMNYPIKCSEAFIIHILITIVHSYFYAPPQKKVAGYYVIPSNILSVCPSVCPSIRQRLIIRVRSITLIPFEIISRNLAQIESMTRRRAEINNDYSTYIF